MLISLRKCGKINWRDGLCFGLQSLGFDATLQEETRETDLLDHKNAIRR